MHPRREKERRTGMATISTACVVLQSYCLRQFRVTVWVTKWTAATHTHTHTHKSRKEGGEGMGEDAALQVGRLPSFTITLEKSQKRGTVVLHVHE